MCISTSIGCFYYLLGNLSPYLRSQIKSIQLLLIAKSSVITKYGPNLILEPFMKELIKLETVRTILNTRVRATVKGNSVCIKVCVNIESSPFCFLSEGWYQNIS